jgi:hypothetical protein
VTWLKKILPFKYWRTSTCSACRARLVIGLTIAWMDPGPALHICFHAQITMMARGWARPLYANDNNGQINFRLTIVYAAFNVQEMASSSDWRRFRDWLPFYSHSRKPIYRAPHAHGKVKGFAVCFSPMQDRTIEISTTKGSYSLFGWFEE